MKATIDLTQDRMFPDKAISRYPKDLFLSHKEILPKFVFRTPVEFDNTITIISSDDGFLDWRYDISGSAKEYRKREEFMRADSIDYCDCFGSKIRTPWRCDRSLCDTCTVQLEINVHGHKVPWSDDFRSELSTQLNFI